MAFSTALVNPDLLVVPERLPLVARLDFWVSNPLLAQTPRKLAATQQQARTCFTDAERLSLVLRLETVCKVRRGAAATFCADAPSTHQMRALFEHDVISGRERAELQKFFGKLAACEWQWLADHLNLIIRCRLERNAADQQAA